MLLKLTQTVAITLDIRQKQPPFVFQDGEDHSGCVAINKIFKVPSNCKVLLQEFYSMQQQQKQQKDSPASVSSFSRVLRVLNQRFQVEDTDAFGQLVSKTSGVIVTRSYTLL